MTLSEEKDGDEMSKTREILNLNNAFVKQLPLVVFRPIVLKHGSEIRTADLQDGLVHVDTLTLHLYREIARRLCQEVKKSLETNANNINLILST